MGNPLDCLFFRKATDNILEAEKVQRVIAIAESNGCGGQCTLEEGCPLYKSLSDGDSEFKAVLRSELLDWLLGE